MHPNIVKYILYPLHEKLIGRKTCHYLSELEAQQWLSPQDLTALKFEKLKSLLIHAADNIPFYAKRFSDAGFNPRIMNSIDDFSVVPPLTKSEIRKHVDTMKWNESPGGMTRYNTGGSSGEPLVFYFDRRRQAYDAAARALTHRWWDIDIGDKELYLWGSPLEITKQDRIKELRDGLINELLISAFEISPAKVPEIVRRFRKFKPKCVFGYPSTITLFCQMAKKQNFSLHDLGIRVVFSTAEVLYDYQREAIGGYFGGIPVVDCYGSREGGFISHQCKGGAYHVMDPNYIIEFFKDGKPAETGEDGEIVITHLDAWGMPFIRYRTGDVAQAGEGACACGRGFSTMKNIRGRTTDFVVTPDGRWQHALSVIYVVRDIEGVAEFKIIQEELNQVLVKIKTHPDLFPPDGPRRIAWGIKKRMGETVNVDIEIVDHIPRDASGKYRYVVSRVAEKGFN
ncbi:MAG: phenylacetate--CoA ligase family protein [Pseudomonadota bacterium]